MFVFNDLPQLRCTILTYVRPSVCQTIGDVVVGLRGIDVDTTGASADSDVVSLRYRPYTVRDISRWQDHICETIRDVGCCNDREQAITLKAPSIDCGARLLIAVLCWVHAGGLAEGGSRFLETVKESAGTPSASIIGLPHLAHLFKRVDFLVEM